MLIVLENLSIDHWECIWWVKKYKTSLHRIAITRKRKEKGWYEYMPDNIGNKGTTLQRGGGNTMAGFPITELKSTNKHTVYKP